MIDTSAIVDRLTQLVPSRVRESAWLKPRYPLIGLELRDDAVIAVRLQRKAREWHLAGHAHRSLPPGVLTAGMMKLAIGDARTLTRAIHEALQLAGAQGAHKISLALPDTLVRVLLVDVQELPAARAQADEIIRLRIKKSVPLRLEDARIAWQSLGRTEDGRMQLLVTLAPESSLAPLERLLDGMGLRPGLVDIASFDLYNALRVGMNGARLGRGDIAVLNATPGYFSALILRGERLIFYRSKNYHIQGGFQGEESLRVVGRELKTSLSYYQEHLLGEGIGTTLVRVSGIDAAALVATVESAGCRGVRVVGITDAFPGVPATMADETAQDLLPAIGLVLRRSA